MNNPWPTRAQQRHDTATSRLLCEQAEAETAFRAIIRTALAAVQPLHFPLGGPAPGYDIEDVTGSMADWLLPHSHQEMADRAIAAASDALAEAA
jgi:hypothetical protein